jgi:hypothetical protein
MTIAPANARLGVGLVVFCRGWPASGASGGSGDGDDDGVRAGRRDFARSLGFDGAGCVIGTTFDIGFGLGDVLMTA